MQAIWNIWKISAHLHEKKKETHLVFKYASRNEYHLKNHYVASKVIGVCNWKNGDFLSIHPVFILAMYFYYVRRYCLTLKRRETHGCVVSTMATDALVLKHQAISIHNAD